ncbi:MAG: beta-glucosidase BglX [Bacteroidota bacterium]
MKRIRAIGISAILVSGIALIFTSCGGKKAMSPEEEFYSRKVDSVLALMTLDEKIGQLVLYSSSWDVTGPVTPGNVVEDIRSGKCGNMFNAITTSFNRKLQEIAVNETRLGIPLLFGYDVVHGYKTIFPVPLGEAASWDTALIRKASAIAALETSSSGINWTFAPMVDVSRDPRWGRVTEGAGEDPFLGACISEARVKGFQGNDLASPNTVLACVKHYAAYGAPIGGRDYNGADMSDRELREVYLPPYKAAVDAGAGTVMTAFNDLNGVPCTANGYLLNEILREEWGFRGFTVSDYSSASELISHGYAANRKEAAKRAFLGGLTMDMQSGVYSEYLAELVKEGSITEKQIDDAVRAVLEAKFRLGLFDDPYRYCDSLGEKENILTPAHLQTARELACESMVLLKNERQLLPLAKGKKIALIGPFINSREDLLGAWRASGNPATVKTIAEALSEANPGGMVRSTEGCGMDKAIEGGLDRALSLARTSDVVVLVLGEPAGLSGEATSKTDLSLPKVQSALLKAIKATGKPVILVLLNGRPLTVSDEVGMADAVLEAWHPGSSGAQALADLLFGDAVPGGKLTMTFPMNVGQIPIYYSYKSTGRPYAPDRPDLRWQTRYIDGTSDPLFPFGYGLSYTVFEYSKLRLSSPEISMDDTLTISVTITNSGDYDGTEVVQLYVQDLFGSVTRPVKELKGFRKIAVGKGKSAEVEFRLTADDLRFYDSEMHYLAEPGDFKVFVGTNSRDVLESSFTLKP